MSAKLVVLYGTPDDPAAFDAHYRGVHGPLVDKVPGVQRWSAAKLVGAASDYGQIAPSGSRMFIAVTD